MDASGATLMSPGIQYQLSRGDRFWLTPDWVVVVHDLCALGASEPSLAAALRKLAGPEYS